MPAAAKVALAGLLLLLAGCIDTSTTGSAADHQDNSWNSGFYGGVTGGGARP
jgi:hypothetical protein